MAINYGIRPGGLCLAAANDDGSFHAIVRPAPPVIMGCLIPLPDDITGGALAPGAHVLPLISDWMEDRHLPMFCAGDDGDLFVLVIGDGKAAPLPVAAARDLWPGTDHVIAAVCRYAAHEFPDLPDGCGVRQVADAGHEDSMFDVLVGGSAGSGMA